MATGLVNRIKARYTADAGGAFPSDMDVPTLKTHSLEAIDQVISDIQSHASWTSWVYAVTDNPNNGLNQLSGGLRSAIMGGNSIFNGLTFSTPFLIKHDLALKFSSTEAAKVLKLVEGNVSKRLASAANRSSDETAIDTAYATVLASL